MSFIQRLIVVNMNLSLKQYLFKQSLNTETHQIKPSREVDIHLYLKIFKF